MEIFENSDFGMLNVRFSEIPTDEQKKILKENGYRWSARKNLWYPMTQEAQKNNKNFMDEFKNKFLSENENKKEPSLEERFGKIPVRQENNEIRNLELNELVKQLRSQIEEQKKQIELQNKELDELKKHFEQEKKSRIVSNNRTKDGAETHERIESIKQTLTNAGNVIAVQQVIVNETDEQTEDNSSEMPKITGNEKIVPDNQTKNNDVKLKSIELTFTDKGYVNLDEPEKGEIIPDEFFKITSEKTNREKIEIREKCREILSKYDSDNLELSAEDREILSQYEGAGGLLNEKNRTNNAVLNEFYTPQKLVNAMWSIADAYAPDAKTVLEPSSGIGRFADDRPDNKFTMYEIDETSAKIAKLLHPDAEVIHGAYQEQFFDEEGRALKKNYAPPKFDLVIGNPPYGVYNDKWKGLGEGKSFNRTEEYFISKGLESLKQPDSVLVYVVPSGFLSSAEDNQKRFLFYKNGGHLVDAFRLPEGIFPTTKVGTDIIVMAKNTSLVTEKRKESEEFSLLSNDKFFQLHPERIFGETKTRTNRFGREEKYVENFKNTDVFSELKTAAEKIHLKVLEKKTIKSATEQKEIENPVETDGHITSEPKNEDDKKNVSDNRTKNESRNTEQHSGILSKEQFTELYGKKFSEDELDIWHQTNWEGYIDLKNLSEKNINYLKESGKFVEEYAGKWISKELFASGNIYQKITRQTVMLSNSEQKENVERCQNNIKLLKSSLKTISKIEDIHIPALSTFAENFEVKEVDSTGEEHTMNLQEKFIYWCKNIPIDDDTSWSGFIDYSTANISREEMPNNVEWIDIYNYINKVPVKSDKLRTWGKSEEEIKKAEDANERLKAEKRIARADTANKLFDRFIHEGLSAEDTKRLEDVYNIKFNCFVAPDYSRLPLFIDGMNSIYKGDKFKLHDQQVKGISFLCNKGNGILAYDVGLGKTAAGIVATVNQIQSGRSKRPIIIVPNAVYTKWYNDIQELFPKIQINDLYNLNDDKTAAFRDKNNPKKLDIPENSISLCTKEALQRFTFTREVCENELFDEFSRLLSSSDDLEDKSARKRAIITNDIEKAVGIASKVHDEKYYFFDQCGFDNVVVDEAHAFKNLWTVPKPNKKGDANEYQGIPTSKPSNRAIKMYAITQYIQAHNNDRNVFLLTATPFTNSPLEVYSMLSYVGRKRLQTAGIYTLRDFCVQFAQMKNEMSVLPDGRIDFKQVMKSWNSLPTLQKLLTEYIDKAGAEEAHIIRPKKFTHVEKLDLSDLQKEVIAAETERMLDNSNGSGNMLKAMSNMRMAVVAPALLNQDDYYDLESNGYTVDIPPVSQLVETSPKLKFVCDAVIDMYKQHPDKGQFIYAPLGQEGHTYIKQYLEIHGIPKDAVEIIDGKINNSTEKKEKITNKFNDENNKLKILIGGQNTSEGIDLNGNSFVMYNCSLGWNPTELTQAEGRIWRQGNKQGHVHIVYPVMNDSIDSVLLQKHDEKKSRVDDLFKYKGETLDVQDINPEELKFDLIKDPAKKASLILEEETKELRIEQSNIDIKIKMFSEVQESQIALRKEQKEYQKALDEFEKQKRMFGKLPGYNSSRRTSTLQKMKRNEKKLEIINEKITKHYKIDNNVSSMHKYLNDLEKQKKQIDKKILEEMKKLPERIEELRSKILKESAVNYLPEKQKENLEKEILNNLKPMSVLEKELEEEENKSLETTNDSSEKAKEEPAVSEVKNDSNKISNQQSKFVFELNLNPFEADVEKQFNPRTGGFPLKLTRSRIVNDMPVGDENWAISSKTAKEMLGILTNPYNKLENLYENGGFKEQLLNLVEKEKELIEKQQAAQQEVDKAKFLENIRKNDAAKNPLQEKQAEILSNDAGGLFSGLNSTEIFAPKVQTQKHNHKDDEISY
jgi:hypothetical protein